MGEETKEVAKMRPVTREIMVVESIGEVGSV